MWNGETVGWGGGIKGECDSGRFRVNMKKVLVCALVGSVKSLVRGFGFGCMLLELRVNRSPKSVSLPCLRPLIELASLIVLFLGLC